MPRFNDLVPGFRIENCLLGWISLTWRIIYAVSRNLLSTPTAVALRWNSMHENPARADCATFLCYLACKQKTGRNGVSDEIRRIDFCADRIVRSFPSLSIHFSFFFPFIGSSALISTGVRDSKGTPFFFLFFFYRRVSATTCVLWGKGWRGVRPCSCTLINLLVRIT